MYLDSLETETTAAAKHTPGSLNLYHANLGCLNNFMKQIDKIVVFFLSVMAFSATERKHNNYLEEAVEGF